MKILRIGNQFYLHEVELKEKLDDVFKTATKGSTHQALRSILALRDEEVNSLWEKCSKVMDENGEPMVVYHGTVHGGFAIFDDYAEEGLKTSYTPDGA